MIVSSTLQAVLYVLVLWFGLLLVALRHRWLSRFKPGFLLTLVISLLSVGVAGPLLIAVWSYESAKTTIMHQTEQHLNDLGALIESDISFSVQAALEQMSNSAGMIRLEEDKLSAKAQDVVADLRGFNPGFLHAHIFNAKGELLTTSGVASDDDDLEKAVAVSVGGNEYQNGPFYSAEAGLTIMQLGVPIKSTTSNGVSGALIAQLDVENAIRKRFSGTRFGKTGYVVVADSRGRIIAHPDPRRLHKSMSQYAAVKEAMAGRSGFLIDLNDRNERQLFFYRSLKNRTTSNFEPMAVITEMSIEEATAPARALLQRFYVVLATVFVAVILLVSQIANYFRRPIYDLLDVVNRVRKGDLTARVAHSGEDEISQLGEALNQMTAGLQERDRIKDVFGRYVTTQVSERILNHELSLGGEAKLVTILFSDIRDFTSMSESMPPVEVVSFLNEYFTEMVDAVFEYGGVLDKYIGDGLMAVFGSLDTGADHAERAVSAALRMKSHLAKLNAIRAESGKPDIKIGIGIHTDTVIVGNIGSSKRLEYTAVGDGVNVASRLEGLNKQFGTTILISSATYAAVQGRFECYALPEATLKGKKRAVSCFEVLKARPSNERSPLAVSDGAT